MSTIKVEGGDTEADLDAEVAEFDRSFQQMGNKPLHNIEKAILKTYLVWKVKYGRAVVPGT